jgi:hypothetical protein
MVCKINFSSGPLFPHGTVDFRNSHRHPQFCPQPGMNDHLEKACHGGGLAEIAG